MRAVEPGNPDFAVSFWSGEREDDSNPPVRTPVTQQHAANASEGMAPHIQFVACTVVLTVAYRLLSYLVRCNIHLQPPNLGAPEFHAKSGPVWGPPPSDIALRVVAGDPSFWTADALTTSTETRNAVVDHSPARQQSTSKLCGGTVSVLPPLDCQRYARVSKDQTRAIPPSPEADMACVDFGLRALPPRVNNLGSSHISKIVRHCIPASLSLLVTSQAREQSHRISLTKALAWLLTSKSLAIQSFTSWPGASSVS